MSWNKNVASRGVPSLKLTSSLPLLKDVWLEDDAASFWETPFFRSKMAVSYIMIYHEAMIYHDIS